jgi:hypothetical protein
MLQIVRTMGQVRVSEPTWAAPFLELGAIANQLSQEGTRSVFGVVVPTRSFAAVLIGIGAILSKRPDLSAATHAWKLDLPLGTEVWYPLGGQFARCVITDAPKSVEFPLSLKTALPSKGMPPGTIVRVPAGRLSRLLPTNEQDEAAGRRMVVKGRSVVESIFGNDESYAFYGERTLDVLFCGVATDICEEAKFVEVCAGTAHASAVHLLRPRSFVGERAGYRSEVVTCLQKPRPTCDPPRLVVFDGAYAYLQWWRVWRDSACVVILDESSPSRARHAEAIDRLTTVFGRGTAIEMPSSCKCDHLEVRGVNL